MYGFYSQRAVGWVHRNEKKLISNQVNRSGPQSGPSPKKLYCCCVAGPLPAVPAQFLRSFTVGAARSTQRLSNGSESVIKPDTSRRGTGRPGPFSSFFWPSSFHGEPTPNFSPDIPSAPYANATYHFQVPNGSPHHRSMAMNLAGFAGVRAVLH